MNKEFTIVIDKNEGYCDYDKMKVSLNGVALETNKIPYKSCKKTNIVEVSFK